MHRCLHIPYSSIAVSLLLPACLPLSSPVRVGGTQVAEVGERKLQDAVAANQPDDVRFLLHRRLGDIYAVMWMHGKKAIVHYDRAVQLAEVAHGPTHVDVYRVLTDLAYCVSEMQRHSDRPNMQSTDPKWMTIDNRPWVERAVEGLTGLLGPNHPYTLKAQRVTADILAEHEENDKADALYEDTLNKQKRYLGSTYVGEFEPTLLRCG